MRVIFGSILGPKISEFVRNGWLIADVEALAGCSPNLKQRNAYRRICGVDLAKDFPSIGASIVEAERILGDDMIEATDHDGAPVYYFRCIEEGISVAGWELGKYLYPVWYDSPRKCLEALNKHAENPLRPPDSNAG